MGPRTHRDLSAWSSASPRWRGAARQHPLAIPLLLLVCAARLHLFWVFCTVALVKLLSSFSSLPPSLFHFGVNIVDI